jgi:hypothetical protein
VLRLDVHFPSTSFSIAELSGLRLDGEVYELGDQHIPIDTVASPQTKAHVVLETDEEFFCISGLSALWVSGLTGEPQRHELSLLSTKRPTDDLLAKRDVRELGDLNGKTQCYAGRHCLNVLDALIEVLRNAKLSQRQINQAVASVATRHPRLLSEARVKLEASTRVPFTNMALARLALADAVDIVYGVDTPYCIENAF